MTLIAWEKSLTPERQAELNRMASQAEAAREHDEENDWVRYSEHSQTQSDGSPKNETVWRSWEEIIHE